MNERPLLGRGREGLNVRLWVRAGAKLAAALDQTKTFSFPPMNVRI